MGVGGWALGVGIGGWGRGWGYGDGGGEDKGCCSRSWRGFGFGLACTTLQSLPHEKSAQPCAKPCSPVQRKQGGITREQLRACAAQGSRA